MIELQKLRENHHPQSKNTLAIQAFPQDSKETKSNGKMCRNLYNAARLFNLTIRGLEFNLHHHRHSLLLNHIHKTQSKHKPIKSLQT